MTFFNVLPFINNNNKTVIYNIYFNNQFKNKDFFNYLKLFGQLSGKSKVFCFFLIVWISADGIGCIGCCGCGGFWGGWLLGTIGVKGYETFVIGGLGVGGGGCKIGTGGIKLILGYVGGEIWAVWLAIAASIKFLCFFRHFFRPLLVWGMGGNDDKFGWGAKGEKTTITIKIYKPEK